MLQDATRASWAPAAAHPQLSLPAPLYTTPGGAAYVGDSLALLRQLPPESIDLVLTSPPFALTRPKAYGNASEDAYADWFLPFAAEVRRVLTPRGSFVFELGPAYLKGRPVHDIAERGLRLQLSNSKGRRVIIQPCTGRAKRTSLRGVISRSVLLVATSLITKAPLSRLPPM